MTNKTAEDVHTFRVIFIMLPFIFVLLFYPIVYLLLVRRYSPTKKAMVRKFQIMNKVIAAAVVLLLLPPVIYGSFEQVFVRVCITLIAIVLTFFSEEHFMIRLVGMLFHALVLVLLEYFYWMELTMQVGCRGQGSCGTSTDFENLSFLGDMGIGDGYIVHNAKLSNTWAYALYARGFVAIALHYFTIINIMAQCIWVGFFTNIKIERKLEIIKERPDEDIVSIFTTFKQSNFFKMYHKYMAQKGKDEKGKTCC